MINDAGLFLQTLGSSSVEFGAKGDRDIEDLDGLHTIRFCSEVSETKAGELTVPEGNAEEEAAGGELVDSEGWIVTVDDVGWIGDGA